MSPACDAAGPGYSDRIDVTGSEGGCLTFPLLCFADSIEFTTEQLGRGRFDTILASVDYGFSASMTGPSPVSCHFHVADPQYEISPDLSTLHVSATLTNADTIPTGCWTGGSITLNLDVTWVSAGLPSTERIQGGLIQRMKMTRVAGGITVISSPSSPPSNSTFPTPGTVDLVRTILTHV